MRLDALETSHPINVVVHHPNKINEIFDEISYKKGASIIRMLAAFLGEETFRKGLSNYLRSRQYGNAVQDDLWNALTKQAAIPLPRACVNVKEIMDTWTWKMGQLSWNVNINCSIQLKKFDFRISGYYCNSAIWDKFRLSRTGKDEQNSPNNLKLTKLIT